jgi:nitrilase
MYAGKPEWINDGDSVIISPSGEIIAGPARRKRQEILYAEIDGRELRRQKMMFDVAGHYARPDVFELKVNREPRPMIR